MTSWRERRWALYAPFYDLLVGGFSDVRRRSIARLDLVAGERVLLLGAGTGVDLAFVPPGVRAAAIDVTPEMLARARPRARQLAARHAGPDAAAGAAQLAVMDGQRLAFAGGAFDAVVLHLILAVIPDPVRCLAEAARMLRPGGRIAVFDKFLRDGASPGLLRALAAPVARLAATDINRRLGDIVVAAAATSGTTLEPLWDEPALLAGFFRSAGFVKPGP